MREAREELVAAIRESENSRCNAKDVKGELLAARADVVLQSLQREESRELLGAKVAVLKEVHSILELKGHEQITL